MTVGELEQRMAYRELVEWARLDRYEREIEEEAAMDRQLIARHRARR